jgi:hypothetical protein
MAGQWTYFKVVFYILYFNLRLIVNTAVYSSTKFWLLQGKHTI